MEYIFCAHNNPCMQTRELYLFCANTNPWIQTREYLFCAHTNPWPCILGDIKRFLQSCPECQKIAKQGSVCPAPIQSPYLAFRPFEHEATDIVSPLSVASKRGYRYILTYVDKCTLWVEVSHWNIWLLRRWLTHLYWSSAGWDFRMSTYQKKLLSLSLGPCVRSRICCPMLRHLALGTTHSQTGWSKTSTVALNKCQR